MPLMLPAFEELNTLDIQLLAAAQDLRQAAISGEEDPGDLALRDRLRQLSVVQEQLCLELVSTQQRMNELIGALREVAPAVHNNQAQREIADLRIELICAFENAVETNRTRILSVVSELRTALLVERDQEYKDILRKAKLIGYTVAGAASGAALAIGWWGFHH